LLDIESASLQLSTRAGTDDSCRACSPPRPNAASLPVEHEAREFCRPGPLHRPASSVAGGLPRPKRPT